jgi:transposase-like protein
MLPAPIPSQINTACSDCRTRKVRYGSFRRKSDGAVVQRYRCSVCHFTFSDSTFTLSYLQKRRDINQTVFTHLTGGFSQRRIALVKNVNRKTVVRKVLFLGGHALSLVPSIHGEFWDSECLQCPPRAAGTALSARGSSNGVALILCLV